MKASCAPDLNVLSLLSLRLVLAVSHYIMSGKAEKPHDRSEELHKMPLKQVTFSAVYAAVAPCILLVSVSLLRFYLKRI